MVEVKLKVGDSKQRDVARGVARIDQGAMQKLGVSAGDVIEIIGKKRTPAIAWPAYSEDQDRGVIRVDEFVRKNAGVSINEYVFVRRAEVKDAVSLILAPVEMRLNVDEDFTNFVKKKLMERTFIEGDTAMIIMLGHPVKFTVAKTQPDGIVRLTNDTNLRILMEPLPNMHACRAEYEKERKNYRFRCLKGIEREYAADYTLFVIPERDKRDRCEGEIKSIAMTLARQQKKAINIRVELWDERGIIDPEGFPWAKVGPTGEVEYAYPIEWAAVDDKLFARWKHWKKIQEYLSETTSYQY